MNSRARVSALVAVVTVFGAAVFGAAGAGAQPAACERGRISLWPTSVAAGEVATLQAWDDLGMCSGLDVAGVSVDAGRVVAALTANEAGPAACPGGFVQRPLPELAPGLYQVEARLTIGTAPACLLGTEELTVRGAAAPIPTLSFTGALALTVVLALVAVRRLGA